MRRSFAGALLVVIVWPLLDVAAEPAAPSGARAPALPETEYTTKIEGTVPALAGRWLNLAQVNMPQGTGPGLGVMTLWEVTTADGKPELRVRYAKLPANLVRALESANAQGRAWYPSVRELQELRATWDQLAPDARGAVTVETTITGRDAFTEAVTADEDMKGAEFLVQIIVSYAPGQQRPIRDVLLYGATAREDFGYRGNYASATIAAAPFPIPIAFKGTFRLYRLEAVPEPSFLDRVMGWFAGCGRTARGKPAS